MRFTRALLAATLIFSAWPSSAAWGPQKRVDAYLDALERRGLANGSLAISESGRASPRTVTVTGSSAKAAAGKHSPELSHARAKSRRTNPNQGRMTCVPAGGVNENSPWGAFLFTSAVTKSKRLRFPCASKMITRRTWYVCASM